MTREGLLTRRGEGSGAAHFEGSVLVIGAGIAGVATALALARRGVDVAVLEQAPELREVGAGLQISCNGMAVLRALGVDEAVREAGLRGEAVELRRAEDDWRVVRMDLAGRDWVMIHRALLLGCLASAAEAAGVRIHTGQRVARVADGTKAAEIALADGTVREAALVVGADGVRGESRGSLEMAVPPRFMGHVAWRALVPGEGPAAAEVHMAPGRHVVTYPLSGGLRNIVAVEARRRWAEEGWSIEGDPGEMRAAFAGASPRLAELLGRVKTVHLWGLHRHPVARRWHGQRVVLVGDAAHPTLPFLAQGANLALEDAWRLADCATTLPLDQALAIYQARRRRRAERVVAAAGRNAWVYHMRRGPQRRALHLGMKLAERVRPGGALSSFDWIYRHDETAERPMG